MNHRRLIVAAISIVLVVAVVWWAVAERRAAAENERLVLYGNVDIRDVAVGFRVTGRLAQLAVDEGDVVTPGQVLGRLDDEPYRRELHGAEASLASAQAKLALLEAGSRAEDIAQAVARADEARAVLANAERNYARQRELRESGASSQRQYDEALSQRDQAAAALKSNQEALTRARRSNRVQEIEQGRADVAGAEATLAQRKLELEDTVLRAPSDGTVMTRAAEPGAILAAGATVFTISLTNPVYVRAYVSEPNLGRVRPGAPVQVRSDSYPDRAYHGQVGYISPTAEFTPKSVETPELRTDLVYRLRIVVEDPDASLRQGMPVTVEFRLDEAAKG